MGRRFAAIAVLGLVAVASTAAKAQVRDRRVRWMSAESENFVVHYPEPLGILARRALDVCERAHRRLVPVMAHQTSQRTHVVIVDDSDSANGSATALPYNQMRLLASAPDDLSALGDYDDWLSVLITHEHTHVIHLDTFSGVPALINTLLGKVYAPNLIQPRWFIEGIAVYNESAETSGGRIRSSIFEMYMRMDALEGRLLGIDQLSSSVDRWPRGNSWYLYGSRFVEWIADRHGREAIAGMSNEYGRRLIPYGINRTARRVTGEGFVEMYELWQRDLINESEGIRDRIEDAGRLEGRRITFHGDIAAAPRFIGPDEIAYYVADGENDSQIRRVNLVSAARDQITRVSGTSYFDSARQGRDIYYSGLENHRDIYFLNDLFHLNRDTGEITRLTSGARARYPDVAPNARQIAYTINGAGTSHLMLAELRDVEGTARPLVRSQRFEQIFTPKWSPDGETIAFSRWRAGGYRDIALVDVDTGRVRAITDDRALDSGPEWSPDGRYLYFSSDRTGISNIYAYDLENETVWQVTNVVGGAFSPTVSPDGDTLVYLGYTSYGYDLYQLELHPDELRSAAPYVDDRPPPNQPSASVALSRRYRAFDTLYPRAYLLDLQEDAFGTQLGITVASEDIAGFYRYDARLGISLNRGYVNADVGFTFNRLPAPIRLGFFRRVSSRGGLQVAGESRTWVEDAIGGEVGIRYSFPRQLHNESISASYSLSQLRQREPWGGTLDPNTPPPVLPELGRAAALRVGWSYSDSRSHFYDMSPSEGRRMSLSLTVQHPALGSQFRSVSASWAFTRFIEAPWMQHHVFAIRYAGGISAGDLGRRGLFSVGGYPQTDLVEALQNAAPIGGVALRGYPAFDRSGTSFQLVQLEYRIPIYRIMRGVLSLPAYLNRTYATVFVDVGDAYFESFDPTTLRLGVGAELFLDFTLGYIVPFTLRFGYAYGAMEGGGSQFYAHFGVPF